MASHRPPPRPHASPTPPASHLLHRLTSAQSCFHEWRGRSRGASDVSACGSRAWNVGTLLLFCRGFFFLNVFSVTSARRRHRRCCRCRRHVWPKNSAVTRRQTVRRWPGGKLSLLQQQAPPPPLWLFYFSVSIITLAPELEGSPQRWDYFRFQKADLDVLDFLEPQLLAGTFLYYRTEI